MGEWISLKYGDGHMQLELPAGLKVDRMDPRPVKFHAKPGDSLAALLDAPIGTPPLKEIVHSGERIVILVSDMTRLWIRTADFLPTIVQYLNNAGIPDRDISVCVAGGSHRLPTPEEYRRLVGPELCSRLTVFHHDINDLGNYVDRGLTRRGTLVRVNRRVMEHDRVILTGGIVHHAMAGYGGGRKSILPGIASRETINANHLWVVDPTLPRTRQGIGAGMTAGNQMNEDMNDAAALVNPDFIVNAVLNADGSFAGFFAGHWLKAWEAGCRMVDEMYCSPIDHRYDLVVASCGGYPRDISVYQASKSFSNASLAMKPGGTLVLLMEGREGGGGDEFFRWFDYPDLESHCDALRNAFTIAGYTAFLVAEVAASSRVILVSGLPAEIAKHMKMTVAESAGQALKLALAALGPNPDVLVMPEAGLTLPVL